MSKFIDEYLKFLNNSFSENQLEKRVEITVPFLDRHGELLHIYIEEENNDIYLTDDGYIIEDLISCGCDVTTPARKSLLQRIVNGYDIIISNDNELYTYATLTSFPQKQHALIQCMIAVNNLYVTSRNNTMPIFLDEIKDFFNLKNDLFK